MTNTDESTFRNYQNYQMITSGVSPVSLSEMKSYLGIGIGNMNDAFLLTLIESCTQYGQKYTGREFSSNTYSLLLDYFDERICLHRNPIDQVQEIKHLVNDAFQTVDESIYKVKHGINLSEIILKNNNHWPKNTDSTEQAIEIVFKTKPVGLDKLPIVKNAIMRHVAFMFSNRGDCGDCSSCSGSTGSNANSLYDMVRIPRV
jgi:hypothetical protein